MVNNWLNNTLFKLVTSSCQLCGSLDVHSGLELCPACHDALPWLPPACPRCATPLAAAQAGTTSLCGQCLQNPPAFDNTTALFHYESPLDHLVQGLKFHGQLNHARLLGTLMARHLAPWSNRLDAIIPVPLHPRRLRERGFNQALELARPVSAQLNIAIDTRHCQRSRHTDGQADLPLARRHSNVKNAFSVSTELKWQHVAIIDDVMTSGQTVNALARALKQAGVETVSVWSCCRATLQH